MTAIDSAAAAAAAAAAEEGGDVFSYRAFYAGYVDPRPNVRLASSATGGHNWHEEGRME